MVRPASANVGTDSSAYTIQYSDVSHTIDVIVTATNNVSSLSPSARTARIPAPDR